MTTAPVSASPRFNLIRWYRSSPLRRIVPERKFITGELEKWAKLIKSAGIRPD